MGGAEWNAGRVDELRAEIESQSPRQIIKRALDEFGDDVAIAFSGAEDVLLLEHAASLGRSFRVFSLDTGRLHPETLRFIDDVATHFDVKIEVVFPQREAVESLVRTKGLFSFIQDGHEECCGIRKVEPLRRTLSGLRAWITGQRRDQSPGTRSNVPHVEVDSAFQGVAGSTLVKFNPLATTTLDEVWTSLRAFETPTNPLHERGFVSIGCSPCTRAIMPGEHERAGRWWWEEATKKECGLHVSNNVAKSEGEADS